MEGVKLVLVAAVPVVRVIPLRKHAIYALDGFSRRAGAELQSLVEVDERSGTPARGSARFVPRPVRAECAAFWARNRQIADNRVGGLSNLLLGERLRLRDG